MDKDFEQVVAQIEKDKAVETYAPGYDTVVPALNPKVVEVVASSSVQNKRHQRISTTAQEPKTAKSWSFISGYTKEPKTSTIVDSFTPRSSGSGYR